MDNSNLMSAANLIRESQRPLISIPEHPTTDATAAALGLLLALEQRGQPAKIVSPRFALPPHHAFLPKSGTIVPDLTNLQDFVLTVNLQNTTLETLRYEIQGQQLHIFLTPKTGRLQPRDVSSAGGAFAHDAIIILDAPRLESLGPVYTNHPDFFYHTPILNIDHHPENTRYGHVNLIQVTAGSVSEIVFDVIKQLGENEISESIATALLAGVMSKTKTFQSERVTPRSLAVASHLMAAGARRDEIVRHLYQTHSVATLRLWGRALSRLEANPVQSTVWTTITEADLKETGVGLNQAGGVLDELLVSTPGAKYYALFIEQAENTYTQLVHPVDRPPAGLPDQLTPRSPEMMAGNIPGRLAEVRKQVLAHLVPVQ